MGVGIRAEGGGKGGGKVEGIGNNSNIKRRKYCFGKEKEGKGSEEDDKGLNNGEFCVLI